MAAEEKVSIRSASRTLLNIGIAAAVIFWLCRRNGAALRAGFAEFDYRCMIPAAAVVAVTLVTSALRWRSLADTIGIRLGVFEAISLTMQGYFFSLVIPGGAIGGDVIKMAALTRHVRSGSRTEGIVSIVMDRIIGMIALFLTSIVLLLSCRGIFAGLNIPGADNVPAGPVLWWLFFAASLAGSAAGIAVFFYRVIERLPGMKQAAAFLDRKSAGKLTRIANAVDTYRGNLRVLSLWVVVSIFIIHLAPAVSMFFLLSGVTAPTPSSIRFIATAVVIGNTAGLIPLFPGGIGARDAVVIALLASAGYSAEAAGTAQLLATVLMVVFYLTGALFFIFDRRTVPEVKA